jgi:hypothetical protein
MTTNNNYGIGTTHDFKKEIEDSLRPAMRRLSDKELEVVFKNGWKPSEYVASRDG